MTETTTLTRLVDEFLSWQFDRTPGTAAMLGSLKHDHTLGDFSAQAFADYDREAAGWLERFTAVRTDDLEESVDRDLVISVLRGHRAKSGWPAWRRDPSVYTSAVLFPLFTAFLNRLRPEPELVDGVIARLAEVPALLASCEANLDAGLASPKIVERAAAQAKTGRAFLTRTLPAEVGDPGLRAKVADAAEPAAAAFDRLADFLERFARTATGDWRMGEELYSTLLREQEMLGYGAAELHERGKAAYAELDAEMRALAGSDDWHAVMLGLQEDHPPTPEAMRAEYEVETRRARAFLVEHGLVTLAEGEECRVVPSPTFQRPVLAVASYMSPPPLTSDRVGHFFVPSPPDHFTPEEVRQRLRTNSRAQLASIAVHEAYPGHHWHLSWLAAQNRPVRKVFRTPYFSEGWALYAEKLLREHGYFSAEAVGDAEKARAQELAHVEARLFRAARMIVDTALHCGDMSTDEAERFMTTKASLTPGTAQGEVTRYCAWPTQAPSYLTGALEIERIRDEFTGTQREFHDKVAGSGALPLGLARRIALGR
ncbi:uncharacterized protein (DUF885 family) [Saccharothrix tamanrassetensis]|uniref:Uncharacterized protein (DUF885 family) n=1 Tax=Saccharothrix tamanrassetensis TaxID=1051531 RepID=A0A841CRS0_9PSEU|nr:DUF885 domain-containing protein [Saccharothrix tamanrassetensis]MBB5959044.1 uncharacterized protein (DUF885 family) [Saccharothrix tamanrassetensis]